jgi:ribonucleotide monophosphatase NagD (HAD superfamily)
VGDLAKPNGSLTHTIVLSTVKTGKYREGDENRAEYPPTHVYDSIGALVDALLD